MTQLDPDYRCETCGLDYVQIGEREDGTTEWYWAWCETEMGQLPGPTLLPESEWDQVEEEDNWPVGRTGGRVDAALARPPAATRNRVSP